jgi:hypothetical protein
MLTLLLAAAVAATPPAPTTAPPAQDHSMGQMHDMSGMGKMTAEDMADCHKCCEHMMAMMHGHEGHDMHHHKDGAPHQ